MRFPGDIWHKIWHHALRGPAVSATTGIAWTEATWNPVVGCERVSPGCARCYAKAQHDMRYRAHQNGKATAAQYHVPFENVQLKPERLGYPLSWRRPRRIFVNSVSDLFHDAVSDEYIARVWAVMVLAPRHTFQVLTKRPERMRRVLTAQHFYGDVLRAAADFRDWKPDLAMIPIDNPSRWPFRNVWLGVSVENQRFADERIPVLVDTPAAVRWLSCEPLLGPVNLERWVGLDPCMVDGWPPDDGPINSVDWVVVGGESGQGYRALQMDDARTLRDQCVAAGVPFFFKQIGGLKPTSHGRLLAGRTWDEYPRETTGSAR